MTYYVPSSNQEQKKKCWHVLPKPSLTHNYKTTIKKKLQIEPNKCKLISTSLKSSVPNEVV